MPYLHAVTWQIRWVTAAGLCSYASVTFYLCSFFAWRQAVALRFMQNGDALGFLDSMASTQLDFQDMCFNKA
jgi:hypothetical protein